VVLCLSQRDAHTKHAIFIIIMLPNQAKHAILSSSSSSSSSPKLAQVSSPARAAAVALLACQLGKGSSQVSRPGFTRHQLLKERLTAAAAPAGCTQQQYQQHTGSAQVRRHVHWKRHLQACHKFKSRAQGTWLQLQQHDWFLGLILS
jgi:hypothetical protein